MVRGSLGPIMLTGGSDYVFLSRAKKVRYLVVATLGGTKLPDLNGPDFVQGPSPNQFPTFSHECKNLTRMVLASA